QPSAAPNVRPKSKKRPAPWKCSSRMDRRSSSKPRLGLADRRPPIAPSRDAARLLFARRLLLLHYPFRRRYDRKLCDQQQHAGCNDEHRNFNVDLEPPGLTKNRQKAGDQKERTDDDGHLVDAA